jgi:hypothetical protein
MVLTDRGDEMCGGLVGMQKLVFCMKAIEPGSEGCNGDIMDYGYMYSIQFKKVQQRMMIRRRPCVPTCQFIMQEYLPSRGQGKSTPQACTSWMNFSPKKWIAMMDLELDLLLLEVTKDLDDDPLSVVFAGWKMVVASLEETIGVLQDLQASLKDILAHVN